MTKVSVIIPNYNHARYLPIRIDSVLNQTFRDFSVLIMDDRSTDDSLDVIERYRTRPAVSIVANEQNSGNTFHQWRKGLSLTQSEYVWIAESDDDADPSFLEQMVARMDAQPSAGMAVCETVTIDSEGREIERYFDHMRSLPQFAGYDLDTLSRDGFYAGHDYLRRFMVPFNTAPNASGILFRRSAIEGTLDGVEQMRLCGDWLVYCRILMDHDICRIAAPLNRFRTHGNNVRSKTNSIDFLRQQRQVRSFVESRLGPVESAALKAPTLQFESQLLVYPSRSPVSGKVPAREAAAVLRRASGFGAGLFLTVLKLLAKEQIAGWLRPLRRTSAHS